MSWGLDPADCLCQGLGLSLVHKRFSQGQGRALGEQLGRGFVLWGVFSRRDGELWVGLRGGKGKRTHSIWSRPNTNPRSANSSRRSRPGWLSSDGGAKKLARLTDREEYRSDQAGSLRHGRGGAVGD